MKRKTLFVTKHIVGGDDLTGNGTRGWPAFCLEDETMVFLKDYWRAADTHPELETYHRLRQHGVRNIATALAGGDVDGPHGVQRTMSQRFFDCSVNAPERIHTRLVLKEICRPLDTYKGSKELISVTTQALTGA